MFVKYFIYFFIFLLFDPTFADITRTLNTQVMSPPNGTVCNNVTCKNLVYTRAIGLNDTLHYIYSTRGVPHVFMSLTSLYAKLNVNWTIYLSDDPHARALDFENGTLFSYSILSFDKLWEYSDLKDEANLDNIPAKNIFATKLDNVSWENVSLTSDVKRLMISFTTSLEASKKQKFTIRMEASPTTLISPTLPHMNLNSNLTQIDIIMSNISSYRNQSNLRFGLELKVISWPITGKTKAGIIVDKTLDDEQTPGAFRIINLETDMDDLSSSFFMQWKPICYTTELKTVMAVTAVKYYPIQYNLTSNLQHFHLSNRIGSDIQVFGMNISFGDTGDKFYSKTNYSTWTLTFGWGTRPYASISTNIILIISLGLGIPALIVFVGWVTLLCKRRSAHKGYIDITSSYPAI